MPHVSRIGRIAERDRASADLIRHLVMLALRTLPQAYLAGRFAYTLAAGPDGQVLPRGASTRDAIIAALGIAHLPEAQRRAVLAGQDCDDLLGLLARQLDQMTSRGDVALLCWALAQAGHGELPLALSRLRELDQPAIAGPRPDDQLDMASAAWIVTALVAARPLADVEQHLGGARSRLLTARRALFPHLASGQRPWYRAHLASFADQVYPVQALARLHASADDQEALDAANVVAGLICEAQGGAGQWWWHYDTRTGNVVECYPVYSVHQHAMAPMALLDLADAGGDSHADAVIAGLSWLSGPPESAESLVVDDPPVIWRKVARDDRHKLARGLAMITSRAVPGWRAPWLDRAFPPGVIDRECRPYELGWLLYAWLSTRPKLADQAGAVAQPEPATPAGQAQPAGQAV